MRGRLSEISMVGLFRLFHEGRQTGRLRLSAPDGEAVLYFDDGELVEVNLDCPASADGPYDLFRWRDGEFEVGVAAPAVTFDIPVNSFIARGEEYERRWSAFTSFSASSLILVRPGEELPAGAEPPPGGEEAIAALRRSGGGLPLISWARRLRIGLLAAAELAEDLRHRGIVAIESPGSQHLCAAVQDILNENLRNYEIFAGKVLAKKLKTRLGEYCEEAGFPVRCEERGFVVGLTPDAEKKTDIWRAIFKYFLAEMSGPVGGEVARLLWERSLASVEPAAATVLARHRLDPLPGN